MSLEADHDIPSALRSGKPTAPVQFAASVERQPLPAPELSYQPPTGARVPGNGGRHSVPWERGYVMQQPAPKQDMSVKGGNRNANQLPMDGPDGTRAWSFPLFDCMQDSSTFILSLICPSIVHGQNAQRLRHLEDWGYPRPESSSAFSSECGFHALLSVAGCCWAVQMQNREQYRQRYEIEGDSITDCATVTFCSSCSLTQQAREIELEERTCPPPSPSVIAAKELLSDPYSTGGGSGHGVATACCTSGACCPVNCNPFWCY